MGLGLGLGLGFGVVAILPLFSATYSPGSEMPAVSDTWLGVELGVGLGVGLGLGLELGLGLVAESDTSYSGPLSLWSSGSARAWLGIGLGLEG